MTRTLLLTLHIAAAAAWLGANLVQLVIGPRLAGAGREAATAWAEATTWLGVRYYNVGGAVLATTGVLLVLDGGWSWSSGFISVGLAVVIIGGALGGLVFAPLGRQRTEALRAGDEAAADAALSRFTRFALLDTALVLVAVLAMVDKWGV